MVWSTKVRDHFFFLKKYLEKIIKIKTTKTKILRTRSYQDLNGVSGAHRPITIKSQNHFHTSQSIFNASSQQHLFAKGIMETSLSFNWMNPTLYKYDGTTNLDEHVDIYVIQVSLYTLDVTILWRVFPTSFEMVTLSWFTPFIRLPL